MAKHALLSPSSAHRWSVCSASPALEAQCPESSSIYAQEGTVAHEVLEKCLKNNCNPESGAIVEVEDNLYEVNDDLVRSVQLCLDYVRSFGGAIHSETEFSIASITGEKGAKGTVDIVVDCEDVWHIVDFKYGAGVSVDVVKNHQLILYALGVLNAWGGDFLGEPQK